MPISIEQHVEWIADCIAYMRKQGLARIEARSTPKRPGSITSARSRTRRSSDWPTPGTSARTSPGRVFIPYVGGMAPYRERCDEIAAKGYEAFVLRA